MLFGQSVFQSVLSRLNEEENALEAEADTQAFRVSGLNTSFVAETAAGHPGNAADAYLDVQADGTLPASDTPAVAADEAAPPPEPAEDPVIPAHLLRLSEAEIAEDLALGPEDTAEMLAEKRRRFAKDNHPDRIAAAFRENATLRMKTANLLVDRAIKDLYWRSS